MEERGEKRGRVDKKKWSPEGREKEIIDRAWNKGKR